MKKHYLYTRTENKTYVVTRDELIQRLGHSADKLPPVTMKMYKVEIDGFVITDFRLPKETTLC